MVFLFLVTSLRGIEAVFNDTRTWIGLIVGLRFIVVPEPPFRGSFAKSESR
jgi:hypothetical protein